MIVAIADTHAVIWYLYSDSRLGSNASALIDLASASGGYIGVSAISLAEMVYLTEKGRISAGTLNDVQSAMADPRSVLRHVPVDDKTAMKMTEVSRREIPDLPDRIIAATARMYGVPLLSRDGRIRASAIETIW